MQTSTVKNDSKMDPDLTLIADALRQIQQAGRWGNLAVFTTGPDDAYTIQAAGRPGTSRLYAEAISNYYLDSAHALTDCQIDRFWGMGWESPTACTTPNFHREWQATSDEDRLNVAREVMRVFVEIYGITPENGVTVKLVLA